MIKGSLGRQASAVRSADGSPRGVRWRIAGAAGAALACATIGLAAPSPALASNPTATPSWGAANVISYQDSDFEGGVGDWVTVANSTLSDDATAAFLHADALKAVATTSGTQQFKLGATAGQVNVTAGDQYRVSAWFKAPASAGRTITFAMGFFTTAGTWLGWTSATATTLSASGGWQYVSAVLTAPATAGYAFGSPRVTETGVAAGEALHMDEVLVEPYRAATLVGAHGPGNTEADFVTANTAIGPAQVNKVFYPTTLPSTYAGSVCAALPVNVTCLIAYKTMTTNVTAFVQSIPAGRSVIMVFYQEPEANSFSFGGLTGAPAFVAEFENQSNLIRSAASDAPNIMVAMDGSNYQYAAGTTHDLAAGCQYIPPAQYVDMYLIDKYEQAATGNNVATGIPNTPSAVDATEWNTWLGCVAAQDKPIGIAEYGLNCGDATTAAPDNLTTSQGMAADDSYLAGEPDGLPVVMWEYWYNNNVGCEFTQGGAPDGTQAVTQWKANETQNGEAPNPRAPSADTAEAGCPLSGGQPPACQPSIRPGFSPAGGR